MNRISVRGFGLGAAAVAATSFAWGPPAPAAHSPARTNAPATVSAVALLTSRQLSGDSSLVELALLHAARLRIEHAADIASARAVHMRAMQLEQMKLEQMKLEQMKLERERDAASARATRFSTRPVVPGTTRALGQSMAAAYGWTGMQFSCLDEIWTHESNWRVSAYNAGSGAYGIPQAEPGSKMATVGSDWQTDAKTQIAWGLAYIARTYGDPCAAWSFWQDHYWY